MAKNRDPRRGFLARWFHRLRWLRRVLFIGGVVGGVVKAVQARSGGASGSGSGHAGGPPGGPDGSGHPAPVGGPTAPALAASVTRPTGPPSASGDEELSASSAPSAARTLVSVPPLADDDRTEAELAAAAEAADVVATSPTGAVDLDDMDFGTGASGDSDGDDDRGGGAPTTPVLTIVGDASSQSPAAGGSWVAPLEGGECPPGYPVKANANSGIYHVPGGRSYNRTVAERCYTTAEAAQADGYRPAKA